MSTQPNLIVMQSQPARKPLRPRTKIAHLSGEQIERVLRAAKEMGAREHAMFLFAFAHGARASEISNLRISDINFKTEQVHIARLKGSLDSTQNLLKVKGNALFNEAAAFKAWLAEREPDADDYVFNSQKSVRCDRSTIFRLFRAVCEKSGIEDRSLHHPHALKHSCAQLMVEQGANAFLVKQQLGHKSFQSTLAYVNPSDKAASEAAAKAFSKIF